MTVNFNQIIDRANSDSLKWNVYPEDVIPLWIADMDFLAPPAVNRALAERVAHGVYGYAKNPPALDEAIIRWVEKHYGLKVSNEDIHYVPGVVTGFNLVARAFLKPGDGILFQPPIYPPFFNVAENGGFESHAIDLVQDPDGAYMIDFELLEKNIKPNTKMFLLCNPHNPVGRVYTQAELQQIAAFCAKHDLLICSDEIHCDLIYSDQHHIPIMSLGEELENRTIMLFAPSKSFNIAGLGFSVMIIKDECLREQFKKAFAGILPHPDLLSIQAALAAYTSSESWLQEVMEYLEGNRNFIYDYVKNVIPGMRMWKPEGTFLAWLDCRQLPCADDPYTFFLEKAKVGLNNGSDFGEVGQGFVRLNFACPLAILQESLERMRKAVRDV